MSALPQKQCQRSLRKQVGKRLKQVNAINSGYRQAATIGLFPHALANMVKEKYPTEGLSMMDNLRVIRVCAARFQEYQRLTIISEAHRTAYGKPNLHKCLDPFHFLEVSPRSPRQRATCHCDIVKGVKRSQKQPGKGKRKKRKTTKKSCNLSIGQDPRFDDGLDHKHVTKISQSTTAKATRGQRAPTKEVPQRKIQEYLVLRSAVT